MLINFIWHLVNSTSNPSTRDINYVQYSLSSVLIFFYYLCTFSLNSKHFNRFVFRHCDYEQKKYAIEEIESNNWDDLYGTNEKPSRSSQHSFIYYLLLWTVKKVRGGVGVGGVKLILNFKMSVFLTVTWRICQGQSSPGKVLCTPPDSNAQHVLSGHEGKNVR